MYTIDVKLNGVWLCLGDIVTKEEFSTRLDVTYGFSDYTLSRTTENWNEFYSRGLNYRVKKV